MNLAHVRQVLRAHLGLVLLGVVLSVLAALFVYARPGWDGGPTLTGRTPQVWRASSVLLLTQEGFPWGRAVNDPAYDGGDQSRFGSLAVLYAELATSDRVLALAGIDGKTDHTISAEPVTHELSTYSSPVLLPMVQISATSATSAKASQKAGRVAAALQRYVTSQQSSAKIRAKSRVLIQAARSGGDVTLISGPSKAVPIVIFALLNGLVFMAVFGYHNYRVNAGHQNLSDGLRPVDQVEAGSMGATEGPTRLQPPTQPGEAAQDDVLRARPRRPRAVLSADRPARAETGTADAPSVHQPTQR